MDDKHIENLLRESWKPCSREGMRERVLSKCRERLPRRAPLVKEWRLALAVLAVIVIFLTGLSDHARECRLSTMIDRGASPAQINPINLRERGLIIQLTAKSLRGDPFADDLQNNCP